ncbi:ATP-dependent DNA ligase [Tumebacillus avium]|nr:DNA ligase [Tumebacillus avium]
MLFTAIQPMLLTLKWDAFDDDRYIFEPKWDGWRVLLHKQGERVSAYTKNGHVITDKFPEAISAASAVSLHEAILDCEGICMRGGRPVFDDFAWRGRLADPNKIRQATQTHPATFVAFDLLYNGQDLTGSELMERKARLHDALRPSDLLTPTLYIEGQGTALKKLSEQQHLEGIVGKRKTSRYQQGVRSEDWIKVKNWQEIDCIILGYRIAPPFALVLGLHFRTVKFKPVGTVELGFKPEEKQAFHEIAERLHTTRDSKTQWIEPRLCCHIQYLERTDTHHLRHATFRGFLFEKNPDDCWWTY